MKRRSHHLSLVVLVLLLALVAACGSTSSSAKTDTTSTTTIADSSAAAATDPTATTGSAATIATSSGKGRACDGAAAAVDAAVKGTAEVTTIDTDGSCAVNITTSLPAGDDSVRLALALCDQASVVAYANGATGVVILGVGNKELSIGVKGAQCIGEP